MVYFGCLLSRRSDDTERLNTRMLMFKFLKIKIFTGFSHTERRKEEKRVGNNWINHGQQNDYNKLHPNQIESDPIVHYKWNRTSSIRETKNRENEWSMEKKRRVLHTLRTALLWWLLTSLASSLSLPQRLSLFFPPFFLQPSPSGFMGIMAARPWPLAPGPWEIRAQDFKSKESRTQQKKSAENRLLHVNKLRTKFCW